MRFNKYSLIIPIIAFLVTLVLCLTSCRTLQRESEDNPTYTQSHVPPKPVPTFDPAYDDYLAKLNEPSRYAPIPPAPVKTSAFRKVFPRKPVVAKTYAGPAMPKKCKGCVINTNTQTATAGATIGAASQEGPNTSKAKNASVSASKTENTGGQGAKVSGDASSEAKNVLKKGIPLWWLLLGAAVLAVGYGGYQMFRRSVWPFRY